VRLRDCAQPPRLKPTLTHRDTTFPGRKPAGRIQPRRNPTDHRPGQPALLRHDAGLLRPGVGRVPVPDGPHPTAPIQPGKIRETRWVVGLDHVRFCPGRLGRAFQFAERIQPTLPETKQVLRDFIVLSSCREVLSRAGGRRRRVIISVDTRVPPNVGSSILRAVTAAECKAT
jgi:hypothetical protein